MATPMQRGSIAATRTGGLDYQHVKLAAGSVGSFAKVNIIGTVDEELLTITPIAGAVSNMMALYDSGGTRVFYIDKDGDAHIEVPLVAGYDIKGNAPWLTLTDQTALAKSLKILVDANIASFYEKAGSPGDILSMNFATKMTTIAALTVGAKQLTLTGALSIGADTSITGGGTLGLGGFTLTVPGTGTAVLGTVGTQNTIAGYLAGNSVTTGVVTAFGANAGQNTTDGAVTAFGYQAAVANVHGDITAFGQAAGFAATGYLTAVGHSAGYQSTGNATCVGFEAGSANLAGHLTAVGHLAGHANTTGVAVAIGEGAGFTNTIGALTAVGYNAAGLSVGQNIIAIGGYAGAYETAGGLFIDGLDRTTEALGRTNSLIYGIYSAVLADQFLRINANLRVVRQTAITNTVGVVETLAHNSSGTPVTGFGLRQLWNLKSSTTPDQEAGAIGFFWTDATDATRTSAARTFIVISGVETMVELLTNNGVAIGAGAGASLTTGQAALVGYQAGAAQVSGAIVAIGYQAGKLTTANGGVIIGGNAGSANTNGLVTLLGHRAGMSTVSAKMTAIGYRAAESAVSADMIALGYYAGFYESAGGLFIDGIDRTSESLSRTNSLIYGIYSSTLANQFLSVNGALYVGFQDAVTNAVSTNLRIRHNTSGTPAAGYGSETLWTLQDSTTINMPAAALDLSWVSATHGAQTARSIFNVYDTVARECIRMEASGSAPMIGFLGAAAVARAAAMTAQLTTLTHTAPGTPDYAIADPVLAGYGFVSQDEALTMLSTIANLQTRLGELEDKLGHTAGFGFITH